MPDFSPRIPTDWIAPAPVGAYERGVILGGIGCVSGQFPMVDGNLLFNGQLGSPLTLAEGQAAARAAAMNAICQIGLLLHGSWERFVGLLRVDGYVACADDFDQSVDVVNAASEQFVEVLHERGRHARTLLLVDRLPLGAPVELCVTFAVT